MEHYPHCLDGQKFYPYAGGDIYWRYSRRLIWRSLQSKPVWM